MCHLKRLHFNLARLLSWLFILTIFGAYSLAQAETFPYRYRYVRLDDKVPLGFNDYSFTGINDRLQVVGSISNCDDDLNCGNNHIVLYERNDKLKVLPQDGIVGLINEYGTIGGQINTNSDPNNFVGQIALIRNNNVKLIPPTRLSGELYAKIIGLSDFGDALIGSVNQNFTMTNFFLYKNGKLTSLDFGSTITKPRFGTINFPNRIINNQGIIAGIIGSAFVDARGFRFDTRTKKSMILEPVAP